VKGSQVRRSCGRHFALAPPIGPVGRPLNFVVRYMVRVLPTLAVLALTAGCTTGHNRVAERKAYWEGVLRSEVPVGSAHAALTKWANARSIHLGDLDAEHQVHAGVEYIETHELFCRGWSIVLVFTLASDGTVSNEAVRTPGNCV
jgi:hypothetical protein